VTPRVPVHAVDLLDGVGAWFTGRGPGEDPVGAPGNLAHRRPHLPALLAADRAAACDAMGLDVGDLHTMHQVHGAAVGVVDGTTPRGAELRGVDALVTAQPGRALAVQVADCVPVLLASDRGPVGVAHAGRRGVEEDVVVAALAALEGLGAPAGSVHAVVGPAIGGCCYEVPVEMRDAVAASHPVAAGTTTWGTPSLDLPAAVQTRLRDLGVATVRRLAACTRCDDEHRWFSHRADPTTGRQVGVVVRRP
jgi:YfiH family protein